MMTLIQEKDIRRYSIRKDGENEIFYECRVYLCPDETGGFYAYVANLPGIVSEGETHEEALENIKDAFRGAVATYRDAGESIPWTLDVDPLPEKAIEKRIMVNA
jgi:predicted RNase H-like HicB family nuclease